MRLFLVPFLVAVAGAIALPVSEMGLDPQAAVEGKLEVREPEVSSLFQVVCFSKKKKVIKLIDGLLMKIGCKSSLSLSYRRWAGSLINELLSEIEGKSCLSLEYADVNC